MTLLAKFVYCPYCGESIELTVDTSVDEQTYIEDCSVCCQPIEVHVYRGSDDDWFVDADRSD